MSPVSALAAAKHAHAFPRFASENAGASDPHAGPNSVFILADYLRSLAACGANAPSAARSALRAWADTLGIEWPLDDLSVAAAVPAPKAGSLKHAPALPADVVIRREGLAMGPEQPARVYSRRRPYDSRLSDAQRATEPYSDSASQGTYEPDAFDAEPDLAQQAQSKLSPGLYALLAKRQAPTAVAAHLRH